MLKIATRGREEHLALARLQHMNIVPLYSEHVLQARNLQILCMPFLGGATLGQVLEVMKDQPASERSGKQLIDALDGIQAQTADRTADRRAAPAIHRSLLVRRGHLRDRGLPCGWVAVCPRPQPLHMDIKPSNVLLAGRRPADAARFPPCAEADRRGRAAAAWAGGTPGYMSPEQWGVITAVREGRAVPGAVDRRTDVYSLGVLLYEALGGPVSESPGASWPPVCRFNSRVSPGLSDIIRKCLCLHPGDRYRRRGSPGERLAAAPEQLAVAGRSQS